VAPLHNEEANVCALFQAICAALEPLGRSFEVLLVDDGSTDSTGDLLDELAADDPRLSPVHLEGNYGEAAALCAGFEHARAPAILGVRAREFAQIEVTDRRRRAGRSHYGLSRSFAVLRDLMVIPYLLRDPQRALRPIEALAGAAWLLALGAVLSVFLGHWGAG